MDAVGLHHALTDSLILADCLRKAQGSEQLLPEWAKSHAQEETGQNGNYNFGAELIAGHPVHGLTNHVRETQKDKVTVKAETHACQTGVDIAEGKAQKGCI